MYLRKSSLFVLIFSILFSIQGSFCFSEEATNSQYIFNNDLTIGSESEDVLQLQKILIDLGYFIETSETKLGYFDEATKDAVTMYQIINSISPASGFFGPMTRASMNNKVTPAESNNGALTSSNSVEFLVEPKTYIPAFYKGAPLFTNQSAVKIIAFPKVYIDGQKISSKDLIFRWTENGNLMSENSIQGNDTLNLDPGLSSEDIEIGLSVLDLSGKELANNSMFLKLRDPIILFYENNPLYGLMFNKVLNNNYSLGSKEELKITAKPFFFSTSNILSGDLTYSWQVNGTSANSADKKNALLLRHTDPDSKGVAKISLNVSSLIKDFQSADSSFYIYFGEQ